MINLIQLSKTKLKTYPYRYAYLNKMLSCDVTKLAMDFPKKNFIECNSNYAHKTYHMYTRSLFDTRSKKNDLNKDLSLDWLSVLNTLTTKEYIDGLSECIANNLKNYEIEINCWRYNNGCWLAPHTDKKEKIVSQLFYFNEHWLPEWGGAFRILNSSNIDDYYQEFYPQLNSSLILVRSEHSWHAVTPLTCPEDIERKLLQIIFWKK